MKPKVLYSLRLVKRNHKWHILLNNERTIRRPYTTRETALRHMNVSKRYQDQWVEMQVPPKRNNPRVKARKYGGDDYASWAVFIDGRPFVTGLTLNEVPYYRSVAEARL